LANIFRSLLLWLSYATLLFSLTLLSHFPYIYRQSYYLFYFNI
jgi:hypothetical protein